MNKAARFLLGGAALLAVAFALPPPAQAVLCTAGDQAQVLWNGTWYPAVVKRARADSCYIHYNGYGKSWDEWVGPDRIRMNGDSTAAVGLPGPVAFQEGDAVMVLWKGNWWPAHVLRTKGSKLYIHYDGYNNSWDEWVGPSRYHKAAAKD